MPSSRGGGTDERRCGVADRQHPDLEKCGVDADAERWESGGYNQKRGAGCNRLGTEECAVERVQADERRNGYIARFPVVLRNSLRPALLAWRKELPRHIGVRRDSAGPLRHPSRSLWPSGTAPGSYPDTWRSQDRNLLAIKHALETNVFLPLTQHTPFSPRTHLERGRLHAGTLWRLRTRAYDSMTGPVSTYRGAQSAEPTREKMLF